MRISALDAQHPRHIFGDGWLVSQEVKAEREKAERFELSEREREIVKKISGNR